MIQEYYQFTGSNISKYIPFIKDGLEFHFEYYKMLQQRRDGKDYNENEKLVLSPSHACETYHGSNAANLVAALRKNLEMVLLLPNEWVSTKEKNKYKEYLTHVPELSFRNREGRKVISPVSETDKASTLKNREIPQLYPVFPYGIYALGLPDLEVGINTWKYGLDKAKGSWFANIHPSDSYPQKVEWWGWTQQAIMLARLGLTNETKSYVMKKLANSRGTVDFDSEQRMRFPVFYGPVFDWMPDMNWAGSGMIAVQEMLLQTIAKNGKEIRVLPAWPEEWDVKYKLHAKNNTTVECSFKKGKIMNVDISPSTRKDDLVLPMHLK